MPDIQPEWSGTIIGSDVTDVTDETDQADLGQYVKRGKIKSQWLYVL